MKRIITLGIAILVISMVAVLFYGCGNDAEDMTTTTPTTGDTTIDTTMDIVTVPDKNDGIVTDVSGENDNGLIGDIVTDVSEGISEGMSDMRSAMR
ncbi:MAG: hypothetical protein IJN49_05140 [Clostridia bacterium]|nr:hypothetical protein [Clostridia bacterium]